MLKVGFKTTLQSLKNQKQCLSKVSIRHLQKRTFNKHVLYCFFPALTSKGLSTKHNNISFQSNAPLKSFSRTFITASHLLLSQAEQDTKNEVQKTSILSSMYGDSYQEQKLDEKQKMNEDNKESIQDKIQRFSKWMLLLSLCISTPCFILLFGAPLKTKDGDIIDDQYSSYTAPIAYIKRAWGELMSVKREFVEPSSKKLLPDHLVQYQPRLTLVMELMDIFIHPTYDSVQGWRFKKRPGIEYFLSQMVGLYEVVIFTKEVGMTAFPLIQSMDEKGYIMYRLFRDSCRYQHGFNKGDIMNGVLPTLSPYYQKDLSHLNRDLTKVIHIDVDKRAFENNPTNGLFIPKWEGDDNDSTLFDLASLLRAIAINQVEDVRDVVSHYNKHDNVILAWKENQRKMEDDQVQNEKLMREKPPQINLNFGKGLTSWFTNK